MLAIPARTWKRFKSYLTLHNRALKTCFQCRRVYLANKTFFIKSRLIVGYVSWTRAYLHAGGRSISIISFLVTFWSLVFYFRLAVYPWHHVIILTQHSSNNTWVPGSPKHSFTLLFTSHSVVPSYVLI